MTRTRLWRAHRFVTRFVDPVALKVAGRAPGFGIVTHKGRKSGRIYHTPVNVFHRGHQYLFVLTYGSEAQWVENVLGAGGCELRTRGKDLRLERPALTVDPDLRPAPAFVRMVGRLVGATEYLTLDVA